MTGLLDFIGTPEGQGLLSAAFGGMASARQGTPWNNFGRAGVSGLVGYNQALDQNGEIDQRKQRQQLFDLQMDKVRKDTERQAQENAFFESMNPTTRALSNGQGPTIANAAAVDPMSQTLFDAARVGAVPKSEFFNSLKPKEPKYLTVDGNLVRIDGATPTIAFSAPPKASGPTTAIQDYEYALSRGYTGAFEDFKTLGPAMQLAATAPYRQAQVDGMTRTNDYTLPPAQQSPAGVSVTAPNGQVLMFPNQQAADKFKAKAGIK